MGERARKVEKTVVEEVREWFCDICGRVAAPPEASGVRNKNLVGWAWISTRDEHGPSVFSASTIDLCPDCNQRVRSAVAEMKKAKGLPYDRT